MNKEINENELFKNTTLNERTNLTSMLVTTNTLLEYFTTKKLIRLIL